MSLYLPSSVGKSGQRLPARPGQSYASHLGWTGQPLGTTTTTTRTLHLGNTCDTGVTPARQGFG